MTHQSVKDYYGTRLQSSADLQTNACCTPGDVPAALKKILSNIHDDVLARYYGCGLIAPGALEGARILDLGCGTGRDVYALAQMVGAAGAVVGVDMTPEQLKVARDTQDWHAERFGFANTQFLEGTIENLGDLGLEPASFDVVVSNCVVNLAEDKSAVLQGVYDLLKPGGEMYFSDTYADRRMPEALARDEVLYGECLSGALYRADFESLARHVGFTDPRVAEDRVLTIENPTLQERLGPIGFTAATYRLFKVAGLDAGAEDYGQAVTYLGTLPGAPGAFSLDLDHVFEAGRTVPVSGNTFAMLQGSRFAPFFAFTGDFSQHFGAFGTPARAAPASPVAAQAPAQSTGGCCG